MAAPVAREREQDWQELWPSHKSMWWCRKERQQEAGPSRWSPPEDMEGRCFNCLREGHFKHECTFKQVCIRCGEEGQAAKECRRPRSPASEDELRRQALAKRVRMEMQGPMRFTPRAGGGVVRSPT